MTIQARLAAAFAALFASIILIAATVTTVVTGGFLTDLRSVAR